MHPAGRLASGGLSGAEAGASARDGRPAFPDGGLNSVFGVKHLKVYNTADGERTGRQVILAALRKP